MNHLRTELTRDSAWLEATSNAAIRSLGLAPGEFAWLTGKTRTPMEPQTVLAESDVLVDSFTSSATLYGGRIENKMGNFACGEIQAYVTELVKDGHTHQAGDSIMPTPFTPRFLTVKNKIITVDTPTVNPSLDDGPLVIEGMGYSPRFRETTRYNTETGDVTFKSGELITDGHGYGDDRTIEQNAFEFPDKILLPRLATLLRAIGSTSAMLEQIAWRKVDKVSWEIQENPPEGPRRL